MVRILAAIFALLLTFSCENSSGGTDGRGGGTAASGGSGGNTGTGGAGSIGVSGTYFDIDGNPVDGVYDISGNPVSPGSYQGPLYDKNGAQVYEANGAPASWTGGGGAVDGGTEEGCSSVEETAEVERGPVDIIWIIDNSCSMVDEMTAVSNNINNFATQISQAGVDHHVVMMTNMDLAAGTALGNDPAHYRFVNTNVGSNDALLLLVNNFTSYRDFLRTDAPTHFVVVTDDESTVMTAADFQSQMEALLGHEFIFHAIASEDAPGACMGACGIPFACGAFAPGIQYYTLADATGGQKISICITDWSMVFGPLQDAVISSVPLPCDYEIPPPPSGEALDPMLVNLEYIAPGSNTDDVFPRADSEGACGSHTAWYYDNPDDPQIIHLCPEACTTVSEGGTVRIAFGCATIPIE